MSKKQETIADIVEDMRGLIKPGDTLENTYELLNGLADRIEAAYKREVGNGAKMREALVQVELFLSRVERHGHPTLNPGDRCDACEGTEELRALVCDALAEPPRNCDVGTAEEQDERFSGYCAKFIGGSCTFCPLRKFQECGIGWAQMPYEEGGGAE